MIRRSASGSVSSTHGHTSPLSVCFELLIAVLALYVLPLHAADHAGRPNIVLIVLDDAAYSDFGVYGGEIATPNIDALAKTGVQFSQFHVTPNCSSTRASLLTGMDHHRTGLGTHAVATENQRGKPGYEGQLNNRVATLPEVLRAAGYRTMLAGKWHLGSRDPETWPSARGFDDSFALLNGGASHWEDNAPLFPSKASQYVENGKTVEQLPQGFYSSDFYTDKIIQFIERRENPDQPFFCLLSYTAPHNPLHAPPESIEKYKSTYVDGWDILQRRRLKRMKSQGLISMGVDPQPRPGWIPSWDSIDRSAKRAAARDMAIYAGMIDRVDENVGRLIARLKAIRQYDNSLVLVMSDNGPSKTTMADYLELDGAASNFMKQFNNALENRGLQGSSVDLGPGWAYGLAAPLRLMKGYQSQGGILSPLIVKVPSDWTKANRIIGAPVHVMDIMPTLIDVAEAEHPAKEPEEELRAMQGMSLRSLIQGGSRVFFDQRGFGGELFGIRAYRRGKWKILRLPPPYGTGNWQLFDLSVDPGETTDVTAKFPDLLLELAACWETYSAENGVVEPNKPVAYAAPPKK